MTCGNLASIHIYAVAQCLKCIERYSHWQDNIERQICRIKSEQFCEAANKEIVIFEDCKNA